MTATPDIGPLSWVKGEIDLALEQAGSELAVYAAAPDAGPLQTARARLHQAHGALVVVGLEGVIEFSQALEQLLTALAEGKASDTANALNALQAGLNGLRAYLDGLMAGEAHKSLRLFPLYRMLILARGLPDPSPGELFFPDLTQRPPRREREPDPLTGEALASRLRAARLGFERGLVKWIKADAKGISEMKAALTMVEMTRTTPATRAYWWIALGVLDALGADGLPDAGEARRFLLRLATQIKRLGEAAGAAEQQIPAELLREALYLAAIAKQGHAALAVVRAAYRLEGLLPTVTATAIDRQGARVRHLRELVTAAKEDWNRLSADSVAALPPFHEHVTRLAVEAARTHAPYAQLATAIREQADQLRRDPAQHNETLALEMATALLLAESALDNFSTLDADFTEQVNLVVNRLALVALGKNPGALTQPHLAILAHRAQERLLLGSVAREIRTNLGAIEQTLDAFFRDTTRQNTLAALQHPMHQVKGALTMLGETRAAGVLAECSAAITHFAQPGSTPQPGDFEEVARKLSALGFFVTRLEQGPANANDFFGPPPADAQAIQSEDDALDAELLEIFLEEAHEVLATITAQLPQVHAAPGNHDALVVVRRGFHTLKGSSRMVGLHDLGEAAWAVEQVMNRWLDEARNATPALLDMLDLAAAVFNAWVTQLAAGGSRQHDAGELLRRCAALGEPAASEVSTPQAPMDAVPPAPTFRDFQNESGLTAQQTPQAQEPEIQKPLLPPSESPAPPMDEPAPVSAELFAFPEPSPVRVGNVDVAPALYNLYLEETRGHLAILQARLGQETVPGDDAIRAAHTTASIAAATGFFPLHHLAHALEAALMRFAQMHAMPSEAQRFTFARCAGALAGMLGAIAERRMPGEEAELAAALDAMTPAQTAAEPLRAGERHAVRIEDEIDAQLLPLFLDESVDLMHDIGEDLRAWRAAPNDGAIPQVLARTLHTLKGSARMAGAMLCGEMLHHMETRIEEAIAAMPVTPEHIDALEAALDRVALLVDALRNPPADMPAEPAPAPMQESPLAATPAMPTSATMHPALRVRADLVDQWLNEAGEIAIARTRIEGEMRGLKTALLDLTESVSRLRSQLREVEIQAETQILSQQVLAADHAHPFDPLEFDRFTRFQEVTRMMAETVDDVAAVQHNLLLNLEHASTALAAQARLNRDLSQNLMGARRVPFDSVAERLHRVVRQAAKDAGKRANLDIRNGQIEMDRSILEKMAGPIEHLLRNSAAHGIEDAMTRNMAGKPAIGQITLTLAQDGNEITISISDDGAGLDFTRIRQRAIEQGLLAHDAPADEAALTQLIFHAGFSTAAEITALSGRGVGMGVVKSEATALGGRIDVLSAAGQGVTFRLTLPQTLAITQAVLVHVGKRCYAIPSAMVEQFSEMDPEAMQAIRQAGGNDWQGAHYSWHYLPRLLGDTAAAPSATHPAWLLQVKSGADRLALEVDGLAGNQEIVVKPMGPQLARVPGLLGATVLAEGEIVLLFNPVTLLAHATERRLAASLTTSSAAATAASAAAPLIMVVDDSLTVRKITSRLLTRNGYRVLTAKDGADALEQLHGELPAVMLVDIEMPRMDGFSLTRAIRADARLAVIPIIIITSRTAEKHRQHAQEAGVNHYLGKPYNEDELLQHIANFIQQGKS
ncbi:MAG: Hpt domain-containing protein [Rugosibacter sp.]